jgi:hypothetical protein
MNLWHHVNGEKDAGQKHHGERHHHEPGHGLLLGLMAGRISLTGVIPRLREMAASMKSGENMPISLMVCTLPYCLVRLNSRGLS